MKQERASGDDGAGLRQNTTCFSNRLIFCPAAYRVLFAAKPRVGKRCYDNLRLCTMRWFVGMQCLEGWAKPGDSNIFGMRFVTGWCSCTSTYRFRRVRAQATRRRNIPAVKKSGHATKQGRPGPVSSRHSVSRNKESIRSSEGNAIQQNASLCRW
jgi:hypothetical protein